MFHVFVCFLTMDLVPFRFNILPAWTVRRYTLYGCISAKWDISELVSFIGSSRCFFAMLHGSNGFKWVFKNKKHSRVVVLAPEVYLKRYRGFFFTFQVGGDSKCKIPCE